MTELIAIHYLQTVLNGAGRYIAVVCQTDLTILRALLGGDDDHTIRSTRTIDSSSRSILQHGEALDIVRVHHGQWVAQTLHTTVIHSQTIDHDQRVVRSAQRSTATDTDGRTTTRRTTIGSDIHTGYLTSHHVLSIGYQTAVHLIRLDSRHRTSQVVFLCSTITDDNHLLKHLRVILQGHHNLRSCAHLLGDVADKRNGERRTGRNCQCEVTIQISNHTIGWITFLHDVCAYHLKARCVFHVAFHGNVLCINAYSQNQP